MQVHPFLTHPNPRKVYCNITHYLNIDINIQFCFDNVNLLHPALSLFQYNNIYEVVLTKTSTKPTSYIMHLFEEFGINNWHWMMLGETLWRWFQVQKCIRHTSDLVFVVVLREPHKFWPPPPVAKSVENIWDFFSCGVPPEKYMV